MILPRNFAVLVHLIGGAQVKIFELLLDLDNLLTLGSIVAFLGKTESVRWCDKMVLDDWLSLLDTHIAELPQLLLDHEQVILCIFMQYSTVITNVDPNIQI